MIVEDFSKNHPDFKPWDPRIKEIVVADLPAYEHGGYLDAYQFIVYLHCKRKIGWAVTAELLAEVSASYIVELLRNAMQEHIDAEYKKLQEMAGGSVDIYGNPIKIVDVKQGFGPLWNKDKLEAVSMGLVTAQLTPEEQFDVWLNQANSLKQGNTGFIYDKPGWSPTGWTAEGAIQSGPDVGSIVQRNLKKLFPALSETVKCPKCATLDKSCSRTLDRMIIHLNDEHNWTREQVADWLESLDIDLGMKEDV